MKPSTLLPRNCSAAVFGFGAGAGFGASGFFFAAGLPFDEFLDELLREFLDEFFGEFRDEFLDADLPLDAPGFLFEAPAFLAAAARLAVRLLAGFARG
jgi:hypothetical protein